MAPPPEYDKEPKAPDKSVTNNSSEDSKVVYNHIKDQPANTDPKISNTAANVYVEFNKHVETLDDGQLRALLDEAITYKCPKDREGKSSLFKELLEEVEQDEQACEAAARGLGAGRNARRGRARREHHSSLQDLVAAMAGEAAPRRGRAHAHSHAPAPPAGTVSARALHGGSLPSGVDTSFLLGEESGVGIGAGVSRGGYLATVRCVNPPPLAERRVSTGDANPPQPQPQASQPAQELDVITRRSKPMFPMTYTARATLEIGSGSVSSGRAVTTTTASNQVRTAPTSSASCERRHTLPTRCPRDKCFAPKTHVTKMLSNQAKLVNALCAQKNMARAGGGATDEHQAQSHVKRGGKKGVPRGPTSSKKNCSEHNSNSKHEDITSKPHDAIWVNTVNNWYESLDRYSYQETKDYENVNSFANKYEHHKTYTSDDDKTENKEDIPNYNRSDIQLRKRYREIVGYDLIAPKKVINPRNFRSVTVGESPSTALNISNENKKPDKDFKKLENNNLTINKISTALNICNQNKKSDKDFQELENNNLIINKTSTALNICNENSKSDKDFQKLENNNLTTNKTSTALNICNENKKSDKDFKELENNNLTTNKTSTALNICNENKKCDKDFKKLKNNNLTTNKTSAALNICNENKKSDKDFKKLENNNLTTNKTSTALNICNENKKSDKDFKKLENNNLTTNKTSTALNICNENKKSDKDFKKLENNNLTTNKRSTALNICNENKKSDKDLKKLENNNLTTNKTSTALNICNENKKSDKDFKKLENNNLTINKIEPAETDEVSNLELDPTTSGIKEPKLSYKISEDNNSLNTETSDLDELSKTTTDEELADTSLNTKAVDESDSIVANIAHPNKEIKNVEINNNEEASSVSKNTHIDNKQIIPLTKDNCKARYVKIDKKMIDSLIKPPKNSKQTVLSNKLTKKSHTPLTFAKRLPLNCNENNETSKVTEVIRQGNSTNTTIDCSGSIKNKNDSTQSKPSVSAKKEDINDPKMLHYSESRENTNCKKKKLSTSEDKVDSAIAFSCITTPEVVASCNTTSSTSQTTVAVDPKPLQLVSSYRAVACLMDGACPPRPPSPPPPHAPPAQLATPAPQPRGVISSSFNGLPLSRPSASEDYKKSLDENGNAVQGFGSPLSGSSQHKKPRRKKSSKNETVIKSHQIDGYQGNKDINEVLRFIESNAEGARGPKLRVKHKDDVDDKGGKKRSTERRKDKESKIKRASSLEERSRTKLEDLTDKPAPREPARRCDAPNKPERRSWGEDARALLGRPPAPEPDPPPELADFQTVTKKRKPRRRADESERAPSPPRRARAPSPSPRTRASAPASDRSNDSNDDTDCAHSPPPAPPAPPPQASYADIARTRNNIPDLIESCNFYVEGDEKPPAVVGAPPDDADQYPVLAARRARDKPPEPEPRAARKEPPAPDVVSDRRPPVVLLAEGARPRDMDGVTFGFDINEQLLGARCDLLEHGAVAVRAGCAALRYVPPDPPLPSAQLHLIVDYVAAAWEDVMRSGGKVHYFSECTAHSN